MLARLAVAEVLASSRLLVVRWKPGTALACRRLYGYGMNTPFKSDCFLARLITTESVVLLFIVTDKLCCEDYNGM